jgi:Ca2+-binding EF-hand superfamily protein
MRPSVPKAAADKVKPFPLSPQQKAHFEEIFHLFDNNGNGTIDDDELPPAMFALGIQSQIPGPTSARTAHSLHRSLSSRYTGSESRDNFGQLQSSLESPDITPESAAETIFSAKEKCDGITLEKFTAMMKGELTCRDPQEEIRTTFAAFSLWQQEESSNRHSKDEGKQHCFARPITLEMLQRACREFDVKLTDRELVSSRLGLQRLGGGDRVCPNHELIALVLTVVAMNIVKTCAQ